MTEPPGAPELHSFMTRAALRSKVAKKRGKTKRNLLLTLPNLQI